MCGSIFRSADCHCGLQDPSCCSARSALPGALHPAASAHYGLPEGTLTAQDHNSHSFAREKSSAVEVLQNLELVFLTFSDCKEKWKCKYSRWTHEVFLMQFYLQFFFFLH